MKVLGFLSPWVGFWGNSSHDPPMLQSACPYVYVLEFNQNFSLCAHTHTASLADAGRFFIRFSVREKQ